MVRPDGGQAFPREHVGEEYSGMTLRDWFAGQALAGILAFPGAVEGNRDKSRGSVVRAAYLYADAMLAEREGR